MKKLCLSIFVATMALALAASLFPSAASAHGSGPEAPDDGMLDAGDLRLPSDDKDRELGDPFISPGPQAPVIKNVDVVGRGTRNRADATTDVWAYDGYAYTGTFNSPCGGDPEAGIWVWDVVNKNNPEFVTIINSPTGSRTNDVRVDGMNSGAILVHSNEPCAGGPGGFEIFNVDDPANPVYLSSVRIDERNQVASALFGGITDVGTHNLWLFTQGDRDYVAAVTEGAFDNFQIFDITEPTAPFFVSGWGAEELFDPGVGDSSDVNRVLAAALDLVGGGYGASPNKFLHDITITDDGMMAYLSNWDAGLVLLDISNPYSPSVVSVAIDPVNGSLDGEVNSHSAWMSEDGTIVVEGEEDFSAWEGSVAPSNLTLDGTSTPGDPTIPATAISTDAGDYFEANPTGLTGSTDGSSIVVDGGATFDAVELTTAAGSPTFSDTGTLSGPIVFVGRACSLTQGDVLENVPEEEGFIAVVRRGACEFQEKADSVAQAGASAVVIANNQPATPWSGLRIWDYSNPSNPVLASTFDTVCSASVAPGGSCDPAGTYSSHNVVVETLGNKVYAYVSWYSDGMLVIDVTNPYSPVEVGRFLDPSTNGGMPNDFWGVYKEENSPFFYGADRNGGLYIFKLKGSGSGR